MNPYTEFERFTQRIYQKLVNNNVLKPTKVQHNVKLKGKSGCEHQIDVYWEYEIAGNMHRVAIECKNYDSHVPIGRVRDFFGVLQDLNYVRGIMVSSKGYQEGAKKFADYYGISLKMLRPPGRDETIGSIIITNHLDLCNCLYRIDEEWACQNHFDIQGYRDRIAILHSTKYDFWHKAEYLPIETIDRIIRDSKGKSVSSLEELENQFLDNPKNSSSIVFSFEDGWLYSRYFGHVKIREVKFEYESKVQEKTFSLAADDFVEAILDDAINGKSDYIGKY